MVMTTAPAVRDSSLFRRCGMGTTPAPSFHEEQADMTSQSVISIRDVDWRRLTEFASRLTYPAHGLACVVRGVPGGDGFLGHAGKAAQFFEIELSMAQGRDEFVRTYLHELGHCVRAHPSRPIAEPGLTVYNFQYLADARIRKMAEDRHALIEREAEQFADVAGAVFRRELGDAWLDWPFVGTVAGNGA